ncbi:MULTISPECIES: hypothetical protein [Sphingobacterium]|uniref:hypothetical protein n=1 Tax=Sphingobacterium TaxID=28453 RepID=UPI0013D9B5A3|nr:MULTISPECIES: hypothetical protein [unclassified Sphingobacterium]
MKKKNIIRLLTFLSLFGLLVYFLNVTVIGYFLKRNYFYSNHNGAFFYSEDKLKGKSYEGRDRVFGSYLKNHPDTKDKQLYRRFRMDLWRFWEWGELWYHPDRYDLPYISEKEINENRKREGLPPLKFD